MVLLSLVLPRLGKVRITHHIQRIGSAPVVVVATHSSIVSQISNLSRNTSSCVIGPFTVRRLLTHMQTLLHQVDVRNNGTGDRRAAIACGSLAVRGRGHIIHHNSRVVGLAGHRCRLLLVLVRGVGIIVSHGRLLDGI